VGVSRTLIYNPVVPLNDASASPPPVLAYIALGSNLGDRERLLRDALARLGATPGVRVRRVSSFLETPAVGGPPDSPPFLNAAAAVETTRGPRELLDRMLEIERDLGRERREKWGPRTIDMDLLLYGDRVTDEPGLIVPHPLLHERRFVLEPLAEVGAEAVHPLKKKTVGELLAELPRRESKP
jgi:2-amino-4-hydroxy-6-hydroxymethyldihydropteridine diphosphokinase